MHFNIWKELQIDDSTLGEKRNLQFMRPLRSALAVQSVRPLKKGKKGKGALPAKTS